MARRYAIVAFLTFAMAVLSELTPPAGDAIAAPAAPGMRAARPAGGGGPPPR